MWACGRAAGPGYKVRWCLSHSMHGTRQSCTTTAPHAAHHSATATHLDHGQLRPEGLAARAARLRRLLAAELVCGGGGGAQPPPPAVGFSLQLRALPRTRAAAAGDANLEQVPLQAGGGAEVSTLWLLELEAVVRALYPSTIVTSKATSSRESSPSTSSSLLRRFTTWRRPRLLWRRR